MVKSNTHAYYEFYSCPLESPWEAFDVDNDGTLEFPEFVNWFHQEVQKDRRNLRTLLTRRELVSKKSFFGVKNSFLGLL